MSGAEGQGSLWAQEQEFDFDHSKREPLEQAVAHYSRAHNAEPRHYESVLNRGMAMAKMGHADEALESWERAMRIKVQASEPRDPLPTPARARVRAGPLALCLPCSGPAANVAPPASMPEPESGRGL